MLPLVSRLRTRVDDALMLISTANLLYLEARSRRRLTAISSQQLEQIYELAYLRVFIEWEVFLEESFFRYVAGYANSAGRQTTLSGRYERSYQLAEHAVLGGNRYLLWHSPTKVVARAQGFFVGGLHESVLLSNATRLQAFADVRHRIVHNHADSRAKFELASMNIAGRRYRGGRPGTLLRDSDPASTVRRTWATVVLEEIFEMAKQIAP